MFKAYQSGPFVELLTAKDKPLRGLFSDGGAHQVYEKAVKGFVLTLDSPSLSLRIPRDAKKLLGLTQAFLVVQIFILQGQSFALELTVTDRSSARKRVVMSSACRDVVASPLHVRWPNREMLRGQWVNMSVDVASFANGCFEGFRSLDAIVFSGACRIRRVFTMRSALWTEETPVESWEVVPKQLDFPPGVSAKSQLIRYEKHADLLAAPSVHEPRKSAEKPKTAFGSRVVQKSQGKRPSSHQVCRVSQKVLNPEQRSSEKRTSEALVEENGELLADSPLLEVSPEEPTDTGDPAGGRASALGINPLEDGDIESLQLPPPAYPSYDPASYAESSSSEEVELVYDPVMGCYYDPVTHEYYELQS